MLRNFYEPADEWTDDEPADEPEPERPQRPGQRRPRRGSRPTTPAPVATHRFALDPEVPGVCKACWCPKANRRHDDGPVLVSDDSTMRGFTPDDT